jgi:hypothetical protein
MKFSILSTFLFFTALFLFTGCGKKEEGTVIKEYPITRNDVISNSSTIFNESVSSDGNGSLVIDAGSPTVINLYETGDIDVENAELVYQAEVKTEGMDGNVYLEMWCRFPQKGEYFSRGLESTVSGTTDWTTLQTVFFLKKGENPDNVKLNIVVDGKGTVWVDDLKLIKKPLNTSE